MGITIYASLDSYISVTFKYGNIYSKTDLRLLGDEETSIQFNLTKGF